VLSALPGSGLTKTRYSVPPFGVDVFTGNLAGLLIAEIEFENGEEEKQCQIPPDVIAEVTADPRLSGGRLALTKRNGLLALLVEFGLKPASNRLTRPSWRPGPLLHPAKIRRPP